MREGAWPRGTAGESPAEIGGISPNLGDFHPKMGGGPKGGGNPGGGGAQIRPLCIEIRGFSTKFRAVFPYGWEFPIKFGGF